MRMDSEKMKKILISAGLISLALLSPAPVEHYQYGRLGPTSNATTNKLLVQEQSKQSVIGPVGPVSSYAQPNVNPAQFRANIKAADQSLSVASKEVQNRADSRKSTNIISGGVKIVRDHASFLWETVLLLFAGLATVFGLKRWADKNLPEPPSSYSKKPSS